MSPEGNRGANNSTKRNAGTAISGWGTLEKMLQSAAHGDAAGHEDQADRKPLWYIVDREGQGDEQPERLATAEGDPDGHPFRKGVERHNPDHEQRFAGVERTHAGEDGRVLFALDQASGNHY